MDPTNMTKTEQYYSQSTVISSQPVYTNTVVVTQTQFGQFGKREWSFDLFDCFGDCSEFIYAYFCRPCYAYKLFEQSNEPCSSCMCGGLVPLRTKIRTERNIQGSIAKDACTVAFCGLCAVIQMGRELKSTRPQY